MQPLCQHCKSARLLFVQAHASDMFVVQVGSESKDGYLPGDLGLGGGDDLTMELCLDCGRVQGQWPLPPCELETDPA